MLFKIHQESRISFKRLTDADLDRSADSNQTHIGLSLKSLTFMPDDKREYDALLIYDKFCDILPCDVGKITRRNGNKEAPKVSKGESRNGHSIVDDIRAYASKLPNVPFFMIWFGLDDERPVFWLIRQGSRDYQMLNDRCNFDSLKSIKVWDETNDNFSFILQYAKEKLKDVTVELQKDLELTVAVEKTADPKYKPSDINKARKHIQEIGRQGEEMINEYLLKEKFEGKVDSFIWANQSGEHGRPYDFDINFSNGLHQWIDVKSTELNFEQDVVVSKNEINFITQQKNLEYAIFRVYSMTDIEAKLKICSDCLGYISKMQRDIEYITQSMSDYKAGFVSCKVAFEPGEQCFNNISDEISILNRI